MYRRKWMRRMIRRTRIIMMRSGRRGRRGRKGEHEEGEKEEEWDTP